MSELRIGHCSRDTLEFTFERIEDSLRIFLVNADESGSMQNRTHQNVKAFDAVAGILGQRADVVILHGFESDSYYDVFYSKTARQRLGDPDALIQGGRGTAQTVADAGAAMSQARQRLSEHQARGSTNPRSHAAFLARLGTVLGGSSVDARIRVVLRPGHCRAAADMTAFVFEQFLSTPQIGELFSDAAIVVSPDDAVTQVVRRP